MTKLGKLWIITLFYELLMMLDWLWLGHAPKTTAGQHYVAPSNKILDRCIAWLHGQIFGANIPSDSPSDTPVEAEVVKMGRF